MSDDIALTEAEIARQKRHEVLMVAVRRWEAYEAEEHAAWMKNWEDNQFPPRPPPVDPKVQRAALVRHHAAKRRVVKLQRTPSWADQKAIRAIYDEALRLTQETGVEHHVDHEIPLQGLLVSGLHVHQNLKAIPASVNVRKHNHFEVA